MSLNTDFPETADELFDGLELIIRFETGELEEDEIGPLAEYLIQTGLVNCTGTYGRFVQGAIEGGYL